MSCLRETKNELPGSTSKYPVFNLPNRHEDGSYRCPGARQRDESFSNSKNQTRGLCTRRLNIKLKGIRERLFAFITNGAQTAALRLNVNVPPVNY